ncbi:MAG: cystathionine gamma-synthase family protein [Elusimicrobiota bacterium]
MPKRKDEAYIKDRLLRPETLMMSYGYKPKLSEGAAKCPIFQTSTFVFRNAEEGKGFFELAYGLREKRPAEETGLIYSRVNNPDVEILEDRLTLWDEAEAAAVFNSGMAAISTIMLEFAKPGDLILYSEPVYGGTDYLVRRILPTLGIVTKGFPAGCDAAGMERALAESGAADRLAMVFVETPANPTMKLVDIPLCVEFAKKHSKPGRKALVAVDNTFLGPLWQHPIKFGADLVVYSATKFIGGHSDVVAGACLGSEELLSRVRTLRTVLGTLPGPWTGWLLLRSLETLKLRMTCQTKNARQIADFLVDHPKVERVYYPGLLEQDTEQFRIYRSQCAAPGSMLAFEVKGGEAEAFRLLDALKIIKLAVSLGGTESLAEHPAAMTHSDVPRENRESMGVTDNMVRFSIGVENPEDIIADIEQALEAV